MERYDKYKDSGFDWIGEIPEHWESIRLKYIGYLYGGLSGKSSKDFNQSANPDNKPFIPFTNIANNKIIDPKQIQYVVIKEDEKQNRVENGDLFFMMSSENYEDVGKSTILLDDLGEAYLNSFCKGFRFTEEGYFPIFINYLLLSQPYRSLLLVEANGFTRINLKIDKVNDLALKVPPYAEQTAIAKYLDRKTAEIDELISQKKQLLKLYEEEKTTIINQAVTKGINQNVKLKESGIDWLGEIPEHWSTTRINRIIKVKDGTHDTPKYITESDESYPLITSKDFNNGKIDFTNAVHISKEDHFEIYKRSNTEKYDIIMSMIGGNIGNLVLVDIKKEFSIKNVALFKTANNLIQAKHLYYILKSNLLKIQIDLNSRGGAQGFLSLYDLRSLIYFIIPKSEMEIIVNYLDEQINLITEKAEKTKKLIELLSEYKQSLISEVVTGKVKVV
jgi:type I restriction enzyme, S subunit